MTSETTFSPFPLDVRSWWDMNTQPFAYAERACRAWVDAAGEMQNQATEFLNTCLTRDAAVIAKLARCTTPLEIFGVQADYAGHAFADFVSEGQKIAAWFNAAGEVMKGGAVERGSKAEETKSR